MPRSKQAHFSASVLRKDPSSLALTASLSKPTFSERVPRKTACSYPLASTTRFGTRSCELRTEPDLLSSALSLAIFGAAPLSGWLSALSLHASLKAGSLLSKCAEKRSFSPRSYCLAQQAHILGTSSEKEGLLSSLAHKTTRAVPTGPPNVAY